MKICAIVGNRPQFIKLAPVSEALKEAGIEEILVHTGQHYDANLSDVFFKDLQLPTPHYSLGIKSSLHGEMTGMMLKGIEDILIKETPDCVLVYGDTNSTLAGALAAVKLKIPIAHIEAGVRIGNIHTPEEANRIMVSPIAQFHFCCTLRSVQSLAQENITKGVFLVGDTMLDAFLQFSELAQRKSSFLTDHALLAKELVLATFHRPENVDSEEGLKAILGIFDKVAPNTTIIFPLHPRTKASLTKHKLFETLSSKKNVCVVPPISYLDILAILQNVPYVLTDSGGLQREAFFAGKFNYFFFNEPCWQEIEESGWQKRYDCLNKTTVATLDLNHLPKQPERSPLEARKAFGDGHAAKEIARILKSQFAS